MSVFSKYSDYYDTLYRNKDYKSEAEFVEKLLGKHLRHKTHSLLSLGCGTCGHEVILAKSGYQIVGVDRSSEMLEVARKKIKRMGLAKDINLINGDIRELMFEQTFDGVIAMFNVMGYQIENNDMQRTLGGVSKCLKKGGVFIFDCWYAPAVLRDPPTDKVKEITAKGQRLIRLTKSQLELNKDVVNISFQVLNIKGGKILDEVNENHPMRYFTLPGLEYFLQKSGLELVNTYDWMEMSSPASGRKWDVFVVARKV